MKKYIFSISIQICFLIVPLFVCFSQDKPNIKNYKGIKVSKKSIDSYLRSKMEELRIPGLSIAVINNGRVVHHRTMGYANLKQKTPVSKTTIFEGASISKSVFAFFAMKYVEEGKLNLDKPLYKYLPFPDIAHDARYKKITARMILSHRSGFPNWRENEKDKKLKIKFEPGTKFEYSGEGFQYLAMVLRHIEGGDWNKLEAAFQKKVAKPLGMKHTVFIQTPYTRKHKAEPYDNKGKWIDWENHYWYKKDNGRFVSPSSIHTEAIDFSKWMIAVMKKKHLSKKSYRELLKYHSKLSTTNEGETLFYTLGFLTGDKTYKNAYTHTGNNDGFTCAYFLNTKKDWGYVLFTNSMYGEKLSDSFLEYLEKKVY